MASRAVVRVAVIDLPPATFGDGGHGASSGGSMATATHTVAIGQLHKVVGGAWRSSVRLLGEFTFKMTGKHRRGRPPD